MATPVSVSFHTLGCKLNFAETSAIKQQFERVGYQIHSFDEGADVCVINTCSVTDFADRKCRKAVRQALNRNVESKIIVIGCYAQLKPDEIAEIDGVDLVLGAGEKFNLLQYVDQLDKAPGKGWIRTSEISSVNSFTDAFSFGDRTRSFLKVQDGCDYNCSFCTIPQARGKSRSDSVENVIQNVRQIEKKGVKEIVLTGVNIGDFRDYGHSENDPLRFIDLIRRIDSESVISRFRISSIEPNLCSDKVIQFVGESKRFMQHFHMPLQSGNDKQLRLMRRRYTRELYQDRVSMIRSIMPDACIGVDVIVGFPGESDADFQVTKQFIADLDVNYLHVFTYSERANTLASEMDEIVPMQVRRRRNDELRSLSERKQRQFYSKYSGQVRPVLLEKSKKKDIFCGFTDNYVKVEVEWDADLQVNQVRDVELGEINADGLVTGKVKSLSLH